MKMFLRLVTKYKATIIHNSRDHTINTCLKYTQVMIVQVLKISRAVCSWTLVKDTSINLVLFRDRPLRTRQAWK